MTFFSSVAAFAMTSFWIWALGSPLVSKALPIPYKELVIALISFALPVGLGVLIRRRWPEKSLRVKNMQVAPGYRLPRPPQGRPAPLAAHCPHYRGGRHSESPR